MEGMKMWETLNSLNLYVVLACAGLLFVFIAILKLVKKQMTAVLVLVVLGVFLSTAGMGVISWKLAKKKYIGSVMTVGDLRDGLYETDNGPQLDTMRRIWPYPVLGEPSKWVVGLPEGDFFRVKKGKVEVCDEWG